MIYSFHRTKISFKGQRPTNKFVHFLANAKWLIAGTAWLIANVARHFFEIILLRQNKWPKWHFFENILLPHIVDLGNIYLKVASFDQFKQVSKPQWLLSQTPCSWTGRWTGRDLQSWCAPPPHPAGFFNLRFSCGSLKQAFHKISVRLQHLQDVFFGLVSPKKCQCQITCKSLQKSSKCQNFLRVWHF